MYKNRPQDLPAHGPRHDVNWYERGDSNSHGLPHWNLNPARLPIPPLSRKLILMCTDIEPSLSSRGIHRKQSKSGPGFNRIAREPDRCFEKQRDQISPIGDCDTAFHPAWPVQLLEVCAGSLCWGERWGSNPRPPESQSGTLPTELRSPYTKPANRSCTVKPERLRFVMYRNICPDNGAPDRTRTCNLRLSLPATTFAACRKYIPDSLWSGLYLHHFRWGAYSLYGSRLRQSARFPRYRHRRDALRFHRYSALHSDSSYSRRRLRGFPLCGI